MGGIEVSVTTLAHFYSLVPFSESLWGQSALPKLPFFLDPLFMLPQWSSASVANRFPQLRRSTRVHTHADNDADKHAFRSSTYSVKLSFHIPWHNNHSEVWEQQITSKQKQQGSNGGCSISRLSGADISSLWSSNHGGHTYGGKGFLLGQLGQRRISWTFILQVHWSAR